MNKQKGFTIVELLSVILILAILIALMIPVINNTKKKNTEAIVDGKKRAIEVAAEKYANVNVNNYQNCIGDIQNISVCSQTVNDMVNSLVNAGYLNDESIKINPETNKPIRGNIVMCYNPNDQTISTKYFDADSAYQCNNADFNYMYLSSNSGRGYRGGKLETKIITNAENASYSVTSPEGVNVTVDGKNVYISIGQDIEYGSYEIKITQSVTNMFVKYNLIVSDITFELKNADDSFICMEKGKTREVILNIDKGTVLTVDNNDNSSVVGTIENGNLLLTAQDTGSSNIKIIEQNSKKTIDVQVNVYSANTISDIPNIIFIGQNITPKYELNNVKIKKGMTSSILNIDDSSNNSDTPLTISATNPGKTSFSINGCVDDDCEHLCFTKNYDVSVTRIELSLEKNDTANLYVGGNPFITKITTNYNGKLVCSSSNINAADCKISDGSLYIYPKTDEADDVVVTVKPEELDNPTASVNVIVRDILLNIIDGNGNIITNPVICRNINTNVNEKDVYIHGKNIDFNEVDVYNTYSNEDWCIASVGRTYDKIELSPRVDTYSFDSICANKNQNVYVYDNANNEEKNTGRVYVKIVENKMFREKDFYYNMYLLEPSEYSGTVNVGRTHSFNLYYSYTGNEHDNNNYTPSFEVINDDSTIEKIVSVTTGTPRDYSTYGTNRNSNLIKVVQVNIKGENPGSGVIKIRGSDCGEISYNVTSKGSSSCPNVTSYSGIYDGEEHTINGSADARFGTSYFALDGGEYSKNKPYTSSVANHTVDVYVKGMLFFNDSECSQVNISIRNAKLTYNNITTGTLNGSNTQFGRLNTSNIYDSAYSSTALDGSEVTKIEKVGYDFLGWYEGSDDSSKVVIGSDGLVKANTSYTNNSSKWTITSDVNLYGKLGLHDYKLSYDANGGNGAPSEQYITFSKTGNISTSEPTRLNHSFEGWALSSDATSAVYGPGESITLTDDLVLYAVWKVSNYTVSVNVDYGYASPSSSSVTPGSSTAFYIYSSSSDYSVSGATVTGTGCSLSGSRLTVSNVQSNVTCNVSLKYSPSVNIRMNYVLMDGPSTISGPIGSTQYFNVTFTTTDSTLTTTPFCQSCAYNGGSDWYSISCGRPTLTRDSNYSLRYYGSASCSIRINGRYNQCQMSFGSGC